jgi:hypothetical protein
MDWFGPFIVVVVGLPFFGVGLVVGVAGTLAIVHRRSVKAAIRRMFSPPA